MPKDKKENKYKKTLEEMYKKERKNVGRAIQINKALNSMEEAEKAPLMSEILDKIKKPKKKTPVRGRSK